MAEERVKTPFPWVLAIPAMLLVGLGLCVVSGYLYFAFFSPFDKLTIDVYNATARPLEKVVLVSGRGAVIVDLGTIPPGAHASKTLHFKTSIGPAFFFARQPGRLVSGQFGYLLDDDGPYEQTVTVTEDRLHLHRTNNEDPWDADIPPLEAPALGLARPV